MRVIIVETDEEVRTALADRLRREGFDADAFGTALEFYRAMAADTYDIAMIDIDLPDEHGLSIASWLRERDGVGIIVMTPRGDLEDRLAIRRSGADIYLLKPVDGDEMVEGVRNLTRRIVHGTHPRKDRDVAPSDWFFDPSQWTLQAPDGETTRLTAAEMKFVQCLLSEPGAPLPRQHLCAALGYSEAKTSDRNLEALVRRLRRKIEASGARRAPIQTVHGKGYLFSGRVRMERRAPA